MYSTGTAFAKALSEAVNAEPLNTAAAQAEDARDLIESWTDLKVEKITVKGKEKAVSIGARSDTRGN